MYAFFYRSRARRALTAHGASDLLGTSARSSPERGVTDLLAPTATSAITDGPGLFVQWTERPRASVEALFARIADERHTGVEALARRPSLARTGTDTRLVPDRAMALEPLAGIEALVRGGRRPRRTLPGLS